MTHAIIEHPDICSFCFSYSLMWYTHELYSLSHFHTWLISLLCLLVTGWMIRNVLLFYFFLIFIFKLYIIVLVLPNIEMNPPQVYLCSPSWTLLPPPSPYPPSGSYQCTSPKHPVSCIEPGLATRFIHDIIHVSMPFSQISPPSLKNWKYNCLMIQQSHCWAYTLKKCAFKNISEAR